MNVGTHKTKQMFNFVTFKKFFFLIQLPYNDNILFIYLFKVNDSDIKVLVLCV